MYGWIILFAFYGIGVIFHNYLYIPLPGSLIGLILLTTSLVTKLVPLRLVEGAADFLLKNMLLFFVPIIVGVTPYFHYLEQKPLAILVALVAGPVAVMMVTGIVVQKWRDWEKRKEDVLLQQSERGD
ncbi:CidA/LrgA family protein [Brevibacillus sp. 7WMA2]|uniref:Holin-like protein CidA n=2 Tax=Brevibacillus TaxID=55080 RepID=A0A075R854_BRELA|nr:MULTISPECIES: CidA/LrgA family protein [Brevibacillus]HAS01328.1 CidA/LrgA family protein [Brevibacillus sp.]AIG25740.1 holin-like protein CidA [Brevibacillus laterosporus LMG 15441]AUM64353.1 CidA/LrgA family protein [Brevibacillus laterosporus]AYK07267.1 CidA/LrgA family protein [Brevibacillus laterosporus]ERM17945.1 murein hydrolase transporter LrgA [Brevibacillus laterosporus PE36]